MVATVLGYSFRLSPVTVSSSFMNRSLIFSVPRTITFLLLLHLLATTGFSGTVSTKRRHRKHAAAKTAVKAAPRVAPKTATVQLAAFQKTASSAVARPVRKTAAPAVVIAGGPWTSPTYADSTDGDVI